MRFRSYSPGIGILQVAVAGAMMAALAVGFIKLMAGMNRDMASLAKTGDFQEVRQVLRRRLNCRRSFPAGTCAVGGNGLVALKDDFGNDIFSEVVPTTPGVGFKYGTTRIKTTCGAGSLQIRLARIDRMTGGWPAAATVETCQEILGGVFTNLCAPGQDMRGVNPDTLEPICVPSAYGCPVGQYVGGMNYDASGSPVPDCRMMPAPSCPVGTHLQGYTVSAVNGTAVPNCAAFPAPNCPSGFIKTVDFATGNFTCATPSDGSLYGGMFVVVGGGGAGDNPALPSTACPGPVLGLATPCACYTRNTTNPALGCACPAGFNVNWTNLLFDNSPALNLGGGFGCSTPAGSGGCGWALATCQKSF